MQESLNTIKKKKLKENKQKFGGTSFGIKVGFEKPIHKCEINQGSSGPLQQKFQNPQCPV